MDWLLYDIGLRHERVKIFYSGVNDERHFDELVSSALRQFFPTSFIRNSFIKVSSHCMTYETWLADLQLLRNYSLHGPFQYFCYIHKWLTKIVVWTKIYIMWNYNHGHDVLRPFDVLPNFPITTSETKRIY